MAMKRPAISKIVATEDPFLVRDTYSKALLNTDRSALEAHRRKINEQGRLARLESAVEDLSSQLNSIQQLLIKMTDSE